MSTQDERRCVIQALYAVAAHGFIFYNGDVRYGEHGERTLFEYAQDLPRYRDHVVRTYEEACKKKAFHVERVWRGEDSRGREREYGWRLVRLGGGLHGSGQTFSGQTFEDAESFWRAMRTVCDLAELQVMQGQDEKERAS